jgi:hypothetical protein
MTIKYKTQKKIMTTIKLYRAIRKDEIKDLLTKGLLPPCSPCNDNEEDKECCTKTPVDHVTKGTKAKIKSRYISLTKSQKVASWYASTPSGNIDDENSGMYVEVEVPSDHPDMLDICNKDVQKKYKFGAMAVGFANKSCETLIKDIVPAECITKICKVRQITKNMYEKIHGTKGETHKKKKLTYKIFTDAHQNKTNRYLLSVEIWNRKNRFNSLRSHRRLRRGEGKTVSSRKSSKLLLHSFPSQSFESEENRFKDVEAKELQRKQDEKELKLLKKMGFSFD